MQLLTVTYHINILVSAIKILHFPKTDFKRTFCYIFCPNKGGIVLLASSQVLWSHKYYWRLGKLVLQKGRKKLQRVLLCDLPNFFVNFLILNVSTVHLNGIWHLIWRHLSKPVLGGHPVLSGHYSIPQGCPLLIQVSLYKYRWIVSTNYTFLFNDLDSYSVPNKTKPSVSQVDTGAHDCLQLLDSILLLRSLISLSQDCESPRF